MLRIGLVLCGLMAVLPGMARDSNLLLVLAPPPELSEPSPILGISMFELELQQDGAVREATIIRGDPPFLEPARFAFEEWRFQGIQNAPEYAGVTLLFKPRTALPDGSNTMEFPEPAADSLLHAPVPAKIVIPGYPIEGLGYGWVMMQLNVLPDGAVQDVDVIVRAATLTNAAVNAARDWRFHVPKAARGRLSHVIAGIQFQEPVYSD